MSAAASSSYAPVPGTVNTTWPWSGAAGSSWAVIHMPVRSSTNLTGSVATVTTNVPVALAPALSVTVTRTVYVPSALNVCTSGNVLSAAISSAVGAPSDQSAVPLHVCPSSGSLNEPVTLSPWLRYASVSAGSDSVGGVFGRRSRTNTSRTPFVSSATSGDDDSKLTKRPSAEIDAIVLENVPCASSQLSDASTVVDVVRSRTNVSAAAVPLVSALTRFEANEWKATYRPSADSARTANAVCRVQLFELGCAPADPTEIRSVVPAATSRAKTSVKPFVSSATRFDAHDVKATTFPLAEIDGARLRPFGWAPSLPTETRVVVPAVTSRAYTSVVLFVSSAASAPCASNATKRPSSEIDGARQRRMATPSQRTQTSSTAPVSRSTR